MPSGQAHLNPLIEGERRLKLATNHVPTRIQDLALLGRMMDVQTGRSERRLLQDDLLVLADKFVAGEDFMIHRFSLGKPDS